MSTTTSTVVASTTAPATNASITSTEDDKNKDKEGDDKKKKKDDKKDSNPFLDHLGKIFLLAIASIIITLVRSTYNTSNKNKLRDYLEEKSVLDPKEFEDFREANSELNYDIMKEIITIFYKDYYAASAAAVLLKFDTYGEQSQQNQNQQQQQSQSQQQQHQKRLCCSYREFVNNVRTIMSSKLNDKGESFTIELGHLLDRMVVGVLEERKYTTGGGNASSTTTSFMDEELPIALFWTAFISAMNGSVTDRIRILHEVLVIEDKQQTNKGSQNKSNTNNNTTIAVGGDGGEGHDDIVVPLRSIRDMVGYLQETCQLPPDTQIVATETKFPTQQWKRASPQELVPTIKVLDEKGGDDKNNKKETTATDVDDDDDSGIDIVEFAAILRTKSVCAWGECYQKSKPGVEEFFDDEIIENNENKNENENENENHNISSSPPPPPHTMTISN